MGKIEPKIDFLNTHLSDVGCIFVLEEVTESVVDEIRKIQNFNFIYSLDKRKPEKYDGRNRKLGVLIGYSKDITLVNHDVLTKSLFPERTLFATFAKDGREIKVLGFHSLTGVDYKKAKSAQYNSIASFLDREQIDFMCFDANEPKIDHYNIEENEFFDQKGDKGKSASYILGRGCVHNLIDAFREHAEESRNIPLTTSYRVSKRIDKRYDYIFKAKEWKTKKVEYLFEESLEAGSDHSIIVGEFSI